MLLHYWLDHNAYIVYLPSFSYHYLDKILHTYIGYLAYNNQLTPTWKHVRTDEGNQTVSPALQDPHVWKILKQYLLTNMTYPEMDNVLVSYLGDRYSAGDWEEA
ncbi:uncharacterized protein BJ212DRAFT_1303891 [Suillus subaureus]|uniref:Uncharacterized protein n=1 Tax=Suillus subaureus TaxID=48587 RepID=A0A9P7J6U3_9AGAM|nr:uncharacterized protein BJ212DRAFT_1303891 [Suillus subaureus]KAG1805826.1 hypothetical protein BJ212DRAFT_1303891 [Suillus subaureus]